jgi:glycosyltransferase involved in cell wall biosynthesis
MSVSLDIVVPVYNEASCIGELVSQLVSLKEKLRGVKTSFIFVDDGSRDESLAILERHAARHDFVRIISFSRNFGHQVAVTAGLDAATADYVAIIDADLQDPPELIEEMLKTAMSGTDIVYGQRIARKGETILKKITAKVFYRILSRLCDVDIPKDTGDFRLISRRVLDSLRTMRERHRFIRGMIPWLGFRSAPLLYHRNKRFAGETKYSFRKMLKFALDAVFSFSVAPLRLATYLGLSTVGLGVLGAAVVLALKFFTNLNVSGVTAIVCAIVIMSGVQILMLGITGEYLGRVFEEGKNRPLYVVEREINIARSPAAVRSEEVGFVLVPSADIATAGRSGAIGEG